MKQLKDLLYKVPIEAVKGSTAVEINALQQDSRAVQSDDCFFAIPGTMVDGHQFIQKAINQGAMVIFHQNDLTTFEDHVTYIQVENVALAMGLVAANYFDHPTKKLKLIGITGTNGKTTTTTLLFELFRKLGYSAALISTIKIQMNDDIIPSTHTTPDIISLNKIINQALEKGCTYAFMEVSSHGIDQHRIAGLNFRIACFSNITHDHLDYHKTFENYLKAKKKFFDDLSSDALALTNIDDKNGMVMLQNTKANKKTYALKSMADYKGKILESEFDGMLLQFDQKEFWTTLVGEFNVYNLLCCYAVAIESGEEPENVLKNLSIMGNVAGRFQNFKTEGGLNIIVDYAHTPDALENVLETIQKIRTRNETLFTLVGCGGNRDKEKRPKMAAIACKLADKIMLTSDNPRDEEPETILQEMEQGIPLEAQHKVLKIADRREAIKTAIAMAKSGDIILIAGKGHETYQEIKGVKHDFDDTKIAQQWAEILKK